MEAAPMTVVETPFFLRKAAGLLADDEREQLIAFVGANPEAGAVMPESGGVRKLRWVAKGTGSGGARVIYYFSQRIVSRFPVAGVLQESESELNERRTERPKGARALAHQELSER